MEIQTFVRKKVNKMIFSEFSRNNTYCMAQNNNIKNNNKIVYCSYPLAYNTGI